MGIFSKLFGGGGGSGTDKQGEAVEYEGYTIKPAPKSQGGQLVTAGYISKPSAEGAREHYFIRADTHSDFQSACTHAVSKARQIIDEQGDRIFDG